MRMKQFRQTVLIAVLILCGAAFFVWTLIRPSYGMFRELYVERPVQATGTITRFEERTDKTGGELLQYWYPVVQFTTEDGVRRTFVSAMTARPGMQAGDETAVLFNSEKAVIRQEFIAVRNALIVRLVLAVLGAVSIIAAVLYAFFGKTKPKKKRRNPYRKYLWRS